MDRQYGEIIEYFITYRIAPNGAISERAVNGLVANLTGLLPATEYTITIAAVNNKGISPFMETRSQITIDDGEFENRLFVVFFYPCRSFPYTWLHHT